MKILKIVFVIVTMIVAINIFTPETSAVQVKNFDQMKSSIQTFMNKGKNGNSANMSGNDMKDIVIPIANILTAVGVIVLVAVTIIMGIKYMFATPEEAAKLKQQLIGLVVAGVVILGATAIWKIVYNIINSVGL
ncbi:MAG: hypothetical protein HFJ44_02610 [Clostridia bacterium]|jgi:hypothetical protein|nr:hypothetical protein [Clostridia bacterium]